MKTIEERAKEFAMGVKDFDCGDCDSCSKCNDYMTYVGIATEQKKIDIDKACEIYEKELRQIKRILNEINDGAGEIISVGGSLIQFKKAMED